MSPRGNPNILNRSSSLLKEDVATSRRKKGLSMAGRNIAQLGHRRATDEVAALIMHQFATRAPNHLYIYGRQSRFLSDKGTMPSWYLEFRRITN
jgi:hypothetical protein